MKGLGTDSNLFTHVVGSIIYQSGCWSQTMLLWFVQGIDGRRSYERMRLRQRLTELSTDDLHNLHDPLHLGISPTQSSTIMSWINVARAVQATPTPKNIDAP